MVLATLSQADVGNVDGAFLLNNATFRIVLRATLMLLDHTHAFHTIFCSLTFDPSALMKHQIRQRILMGVSWLVSLRLRLLGSLLRGSRGCSGRTVSSDWAHREDAHFVTSVVLSRKGHTTSRSDTRPDPTEKMQHHAHALTPREDHFGYGISSCRRRNVSRLTGSISIDSPSSVLRRLGVSK